MPYELSVAIRLLVSALLGGLIGLERESLNKSAGFRTHTLVCLGACLIMITSIEMYTNIGRGSVADPGRLAAQVVSGVGFLGAGSIMRSGFGIRGLTTAATLWVVSGIGLAVGIGNYYTAVVTTVIVYFILVYMNWVEKVLFKRTKKSRRIQVLIADIPGQLGLVSGALGELDIHIRNVEMSEPTADNKIKMLFEINIPNQISKAEIEEKIAKLQGVFDVSIS